MLFLRSAMTKILKINLIAIFISLALGQLVRFNLTPQIAFYLHDLLIVSFIILSFINYFIRQFFIKPTISFAPLLKLNHQLKKIFGPLIIYFIIFIIFYLMIQNFFIVHSSIAYLYQCRFFLYLIFLFLLFFQPLFSTKKQSLLISTFFITFAFLGFTQYLLIPDTSALEYLGWDDHYYRLISTWLDPAFTGLAFVFGIIFYSSLFSLKKINIHCKKTIISIIIFLFIALILTYSRSSYLALFAVGAFYFYHHQKTFAVSLKNYWFQLGRKKQLFITSALFGFITVVIISLTFLGFKHPSDSTNLFRTNSITIRLEALQNKTKSLNLQAWLFGKGFFIGDSEPNNLYSPSNQEKMSKQTMAFSDNLLILLITFLGLPVSMILIWYLYRFLKYLYFFYESNFYLLLAVIVNAQFNQSFFQPFVLLLFGLLSIFFYHANSHSKATKHQL